VTITAANPGPSPGDIRIQYTYSNPAGNTYGVRITITDQVTGQQPPPQSYRVRNPGNQVVPTPFVAASVDIFVELLNTNGTVIATTTGFGITR
jgi:hypothetical protein